LRHFAFMLLRSTPAPPVVPFCFHAPQFHTRAAVHAMASLGCPDHFQSEAALNLVRDLLGWSVPAYAARIRAGVAPHGALAIGEFVLFISYVSCGLALPISPFFLLLLEEFGLQLQHLTPHSILQAAIFVHLCEMFVGVAPCTSLFRHFFVLVKSGKARDHLALPSWTILVPAEQWAIPRPQALENQAIAITRAPTRTGQDQDLGNWWSDLHACGRRLPEAPGHAAADEVAPVLLVHWPE
jgi:hypothetical protein